MAQPNTKRNPGYFPTTGPKDRVVRVTIEMNMNGNAGEITILKNAAMAAKFLAEHGAFQSWVKTITTEVLDTTV